LEIKVLAKNTAILASPKVLAFMVGLIKSKLIAVWLGVTGFGIIDQLTSTIKFLRQSTLSFMPDGMVKLIAKERSEDFNKVTIASIIKTYFIMVVPIMILVTLLAYIFVDELTVFILGDISYKSYVQIVLVAVPVTFFAASFAALLKSFKEIKAIAMKEIYIMIINFLIFIPLVFFFGVEGGVYFVSFSFVVIMVVTFVIAKKMLRHNYGITIESIVNSLFSHEHFRELLTFVGIGVIVGSLKVFENMASRAIVVNELGVDKIGLYAPISKWQALFLGFILPSIYTYLYPRLSEAKNDKEITMVINDVLRLVTFITLPFVIFGIATRSWIIPLFYSKDFSEAAMYLPLHFSFMLAAVWATIFEQIFAPTGRLKIFLVFMVIIHLLSLFLVYYFVPKIGLYGYILRFTATPLLLIVIFFVFWRKEISFKLKNENLLIVLFSLFCVTVLYFFRDLNDFIQGTVAVLLVSAMYFTLNSKEKDFIRKKLSGILKR
jgi:O-antigen/teichoic acid export membrane protein